MKQFTPLLNALRHYSHSYSKHSVPTTIYQAVFEKHGVPLTFKEAFVSGNLPEAERIRAILEKPEVQTKWYAAKNGYSTPQEIDMLSSDAIAMMEKKSHPSPT